MENRQVDARARQLVEQPCRVTMAGYVNPMEDAAAERRKSTFNPDELAAFLHGGEDKLARRWGRELTLWGRASWRGCMDGQRPQSVHACDVLWF